MMIIIDDSVIKELEDKFNVTFSEIGKRYITLHCYESLTVHLIEEIEDFLGVEFVHHTTTTFDFSITMWRYIGDE